MGSGTSASALRSAAFSISIHPLRGEWDAFAEKLDKNKKISIHPLRGEWDQALCDKAFKKRFISIHPLRGEWDFTDDWYSKENMDFNPPTPWGVGRSEKIMKINWKQFQSTHSVGSGTTEFLKSFGLSDISIHPLRGEWDLLQADVCPG